MSNTYTKLVKLQEVEFYKIACVNNISPRIVDCSPVKDGLYELTTCRYPETLYDVMADKNRREESLLIISQARDLIRKLHSIGILHNDLSEENIVYDKTTSSVAIIDFGLSRYIDSITSDEIPSMVENLYEGVQYATISSCGIEYLLSVELGILAFLESAFH